MSETREPIVIRFSPRDQLNLWISSFLKNDLLLEAFKSVDRADFVPPEFQDIAYEDRAIDVAANISISQPSLVIDMCEFLEIKEGMKILDIGTGTGFQAQILAKCGCQVYTIDRDVQIVETAKKSFAKYGTENIQTFVGDGAAGLEEHGPFDAIIVSAQLRDMTYAILQQLKEGGILVCPIGMDPDSCDLVKGRREGNKFKVEERQRGVRFHKLFSEIYGGWTADLIEKSRLAKKEALTREKEEKGEEGKLFFDGLIKEINEKAGEPHFQDFEDFLNRGAIFVRLEDEAYEHLVEPDTDS